MLNIFGKALLGLDLFNFTLFAEKLEGFFFYRFKRFSYFCGFNNNS
jgi:hypothetical protein